MVHSGRSGLYARRTIHQFASSVSVFGVLSCLKACSDPTFIPPFDFRLGFGLGTELKRDLVWLFGCSKTTTQSQLNLVLVLVSRDRYPPPQLLTDFHDFWFYRTARVCSIIVTVRPKWILDYFPSILMTNQSWQVDRAKINRSARTALWVVFPFDLSIFQDSLHTKHVIYQ